MLKKFLKEVITIIVGKQAEGIVELLISEKYVNEFLIAKKMNLTINQTRNILYKISDYGLVSSTRKKDKKKGWYTYSWKIEIFKSLLFLRKNIIKKKSQIDHQINSRETRQFYVCERCNMEINEENAMLYNFTCNECGDIFVLKNNEKFLRDLKRNLSKLNRELGFVDEEIEKQKIKMDKKKMGELNKQEKIKLETRKKAAAIRKFEKSKLPKKTKSVKKIVKKIVAKKKAHHGRTTSYPNNLYPKGHEKVTRGHERVARTRQQAPKDFLTKSLQGAKKKIVSKKLIKKKIPAKKKIIKKIVRKK